MILAIGFLLIDRAETLNVFLKKRSLPANVYCQGLVQTDSVRDIHFGSMSGWLYIQRFHFQTTRNEWNILAVECLPKIAHLGGK